MSSIFHPVLNGWVTALFGPGTEYYRRGQLLASTDQDGADWFVTVNVGQHKGVEGPFENEMDAQRFVEEVVK